MEFKEGEIVRVSDTKCSEVYCDRIFVKDLGEDYLYRYLVVGLYDTPNTGEVTSYRFIKDSVVEVTMEEVADKFGISVNRLKIK